MLANVSLRFIQVTFIFCVWFCNDFVSDWTVDNSTKVNTMHAISAAAATATGATTTKKARSTNRLELALLSDLLLSLFRCESWRDK